MSEIPANLDQSIAIQDFNDKDDTSSMADIRDLQLQQQQEIQNVIQNDNEAKQNIINLSIIEKLKSHYQKYETWRNSIQKHNQAIDSIHKQITHKLNSNIKQSDMLNQKIISYIKEQLHLYQLHIKNLQKKKVQLVDKNQKQQFYDQFERFMIKINQQQDSHLNEYIGFVNYVEKLVLAEIQTERKSYKKSVNSFIQKIKNRKNAVQKTEKNIGKSNLAFQKQILQMMKNKESKKNDQYVQLFTILENYQQYNKQMKELNKDILEFVKQLKTIEIARVKMYKGAFIDLITKQKQLYGSENKNKDELMVLQNLDLENELVQYQNLIGEEQQAMLTEYDIQEFDNSELVVQQFEISKDVGMISTNFVKLAFVFTIEKNLVIIDNTKQKVVSVLDASKCSVRQKKGDIYEIISSSKGILGESKSKMTVQFKTNEDKRKFEEQLQFFGC